MEFAPNSFRFISAITKCRGGSDNDATEKCSESDSHRPAASRTAHAAMRGAAERRRPSGRSSTAPRAGEAECAGTPDRPGITAAQEAITQTRLTFAFLLRIVGATGGP